MQIEARGPAEILEEIRLHLEDELQKRGYVEGPKFSSIDTGIVIDYVKGDSIVTLQVTEESTVNESVLRMETEQELKELQEAWDDALISFGQRVNKLLHEIAVDREKVKKALS